MHWRIKPARVWTWCVALFAFSQFSLLGATVTLMHFGSPWRYYDAGNFPGVNWFASGFPDGNWNFDYSEFGYGESDEETTLAPVTTAYFRTFLTVTNPAEYTSFTLRLHRDDGAAVYINGTEVLRNNLPAGQLTYETRASSGLDGGAEDELVVTNLPIALFQEGVNLLAVEVHQANPSGSDLSFNLQLVANVSSNAPGPVTIVRGPYLQVATSSNIIIRWRTSSSADSVVRYGINASALTNTATGDATVTDHEVQLNRLQPDTRYFYSIGTSTQMLAGDDSYFFATAPLPGTVKPFRFWVIGDFGTGFSAQRNVRSAYTNFTATRHTDAWLFLGDNAYQSGLDHEYQSYVFNIYPRELRRMVVWPAIGNHETGQSQTLSDDFDYYRIFTMPRNGEAGGVASGTEHYYSYDYGNVHFIVLDSMTAIYRQPDSAMANWLRADLAETTRDWIIAYFHHPPYTKGSHNSDAEGDLIQMRMNIVPILEEGGVDLVMAGHSHSFERSFLIDGQYDRSSTLNSTNLVDGGDGKTNGSGPYLKPAGGMGSRRGTIYIVDGSSGGQGGGGSLDHPAMYFSTLQHGSLVLDVHGLRLDGTFVTSEGELEDTFTILKEDYPNAPRPTVQIVRAGTNAVISWPTSVPEYHLESTPDVPSAEWTVVSTTVQTNGRRKSVALPLRAPSEFFQLRRQP